MLWDEVNMNAKNCSLTFFAAVLVAGCVTETAYVHQDVATGETLDFGRVNQARKECLKTVETPKSETEDKPLVANTPEGAAVAAVASVVSEATLKDKQRKEYMRALDECLLKRGIEKVILK